MQINMSDTHKITENNTKKETPEYKKWQNLCDKQARTIKNRGGSNDIETLTKNISNRAIHGIFVTQHFNYAAINEFKKLIPEIMKDTKSWLFLVEGQNIGHEDESLPFFQFSKKFKIPVIDHIPSSISPEIVSSLIKKFGEVDVARSYLDMIAPGGTLTRAQTKDFSQRSNISEKSLNAASKKASYMQKNMEKGLQIKQERVRLNNKLAHKKTVDAINAHPTRKNVLILAGAAHATIIDEKKNPELSTIKATSEKEARAASLPPFTNEEIYRLACIMQIDFKHLKS